MNKATIQAGAKKIKAGATKYGVYIAAGLALIVGGVAVYYIFFKKDTVAADLDKLKAQGVIPTFSDSQAKGYADQLDDLLDAYFIKDDAIMSIFGRCVNLADVLLIVSQYGSRFHFAVNYVGEFTLPEFISKRLSQSTIDAINTGLSAKNINYKF